MVHLLHHLLLLLLLCTGHVDGVARRVVLLQNVLRIIWVVRVRVRVCHWIGVVAARIVVLLVLSVAH